MVALAYRNTMSEDKDIGWMYQGAKALVNREDYLLGKKIDKNFEKYSDAVNEQKPEALDALLHTRTVVKPQPSAVKTSALESYVVATEDPLVAVKKKKKSRESTEKASTSEVTSKRKASRHQRSDSTSTSGSDSDSESRSGRGHSRKQSDARKSEEQARGHLLQFQVKEEELDHLWNLFNDGDEAHLPIPRGMVPRIAHQLLKTGDINLEKFVKEDRLLVNSVLRVGIEVVAGGGLGHQNARDLPKSLIGAEIPLLRSVQDGPHQGTRGGVITLLQRHLEETKEKVTLKLEVILHEQM
ncbi:hypothetical protein ANCCAN_20263 [Ancylostoma caninum]|uniref:Uncharacterized protein n=1 Tax=Ancylostoma caninum TaxID=29170 RepID=A0A368FP31_ANCCA|nr:hypothetical protein ANCCAN_20263 [Ancylostoma caninum]